MVRRWLALVYYVSIVGTRYIVCGRLFRCCSACGGTVLPKVSVRRFCARKAQKRRTKEEKYRCERAQTRHRVRLV